MQIHQFRAMGSPCAFHYEGPSDWTGDMAALLATQEVRRIEGKYSLFSHSGVLADINRAAADGDAIDVDEETAQLLDFAFTCFDRSNGLFDITAGILRHAYDFSAHAVRRDVDMAAVLARTGMSKLDWQPPRLAFAATGMRLDFGGLGKEYAVDRAGQIFLANGVESCLIDLGGDLLALGPPVGADAWTIGVRDPLTDHGVLTEIALAKGAVATSGDSENYVLIDGTRHSHVIDPGTGIPTKGIASVTVMARTCMVAGAAATIGMLKGVGAVDWLSRQAMPYLVVETDGRRSERLP